MAELISSIIGEDRYRATYTREEITRHLLNIASSDPRTKHNVSTDWNDEGTLVIEYSVYENTTQY